MQPQKKRAYLDSLGSGATAEDAARKVGRDPSTVWRWRQADPEFDREVREAMGVGEEIRLATWEETVFERIIGGKVSAALEIFYVINLSRRVAARAGEEARWKHVQRFEGPADVHPPLIPISVLQGLVR